MNQDVNPDRVSGCLVGLAVGDALGAALEFMPRDAVHKRFPGGLRDMIASPLWRQGEYTDDTQMALLLAESLLDLQGLVLSDAAQRFQTWVRTAKDVGIQTRAVIQDPEYLTDPETCSARYFANHPLQSAGNGALMRCAPVALFYGRSHNAIPEASRRSARLTHHDPRAQSSCVILNLWIAQMISAGTRDARESVLASLPASEESYWERLAGIEQAAEHEISSSGYTVHTLEAATWSFLMTDSFEEAVVRAANLGDDADTVAAVAGALAGAYYGYSAIPKRWLRQLKDEVRIRGIALRLAGC